MNASTIRHPGGTRFLTARMWVALCALSIAGCGGGSSGGSAVSFADGATPAASSCDPNNPATFGECGTLLVGLTDADGDFLSYSVDVVSLTLESANGATVEALPVSTRIDFAQYVELTELVSAATVPPGTYVAGTITLDYSDADIMVESGGAAKDAVAVNDAGDALSQSSFRIELDGRNRLRIAPRRSALLNIDFDLGASHDVDIASTPAVATARPFILGEIDPVDSKDIRVRGPMAETDVTAMTYSVALRPFHDRRGDFGPVTVNVTEETRFEVNGESLTGSAGLQALSDAGQGTPTAATGTLSVAEREFTAEIVLAGSSVPGTDSDAAKGNVVARNGNELVVRGATLVRRDTRAVYRDDVMVSIGPNTKVYKDSQDNLLDIDAISVGQAVTVRGEVTVDDELGVHIDATAGAIRMHITHLSGTVNTVLPGQVDITLRSIDRRAAEVFDFSGTGASPELDADPSNYEISTSNLSLDAQSAGQAIVAYGYPNAFAGAPPDFEGRTLVEFTDVRSALGIGWGEAGTTAPFLSMSNEGLVLDIQSPDIDRRHHIKKGPRVIDLTSLASGTVMAPSDSERQLYAIKTADSQQMYSDFSEFIAALMLELDGVNSARSAHARGTYDADSNTFSAYKVFIHIMEP
jgi:hypothetical protein